MNEPTWSFVIPGEPRSGKNSMQIGRRGGLFKSKAASAWVKAAVPILLVQHKGPLIEGPLAIAARYYNHKTRPDGDNMQALLWDVLKGTVVVDDKQFMQWYGSRHIDHEEPRTECYLWRVNA